MRNRTMMQMFEWYLPNDGSHWDTLAEHAEELGRTGINMAWMPPAYKGFNGKDDVGYGVYDMYDLGEFDQKGTVPTKYGTKDQYLRAIRAMKEHGIEVLGDIVMNHRMGADEKEPVKAKKVSASDRNRIVTPLYEIEAWTKFNFPGRAGKYSAFRWNAEHFTGVDFDARTGENGVYLFKDKAWDDDVDAENCNYDYLMGADIDLRDKDVYRELVAFGKWYCTLAELDGFRLDAVKHMCAGFYGQWVADMRAYTGRELFTVGEYWSSDLGNLRRYIDQTEGQLSLFDVPLHMKFYRASIGNSDFDMSRLFEDTLTGVDAWHAVTFVDNHDTQPGQALGTFVLDWFKPIAYAIILLQERGVPCVFYGDYYGIPHDHVQPVAGLKTLISLRQTHACGAEHDYYDHHNVVGFTREGDGRADGLAVLCTDGPRGCKWMEVGRAHAGQTYMDALGNRPEKVMINEDGWGEFFVEGGSVSVWIPE